MYKVTHSETHANMLGFSQKPTDNLSSVWEKKKSHSLHTRWKYCLLNCVLQRCCLDADQPKIKNSDGENLSNHYGKPFCNTEPIRESFRLVHREVSMSRVSDLMGKSNGVIHFNILCYSWNESPTMYQC